MKSSLDVVKYLIEQAKVDVNMVNSYKQTPLMLAILAAYDASTPHYLIQIPSVDVNVQDSVSIFQVLKTNLRLNYVLTALLAW